MLQDWTGEAELSDAVLATAQRLPSAKFIITTLGTRGAVLLERASRAGQEASLAQVRGMWDGTHAALQQQFMGSFLGSSEG